MVNLKQNTTQYEGNTFHKRTVNSQCHVILTDDHNTCDFFTGDFGPSEDSLRSYLVREIIIYHNYHLTIK